MFELRRTCSPAGGQHRHASVRTRRWLVEKHGTKRRRSWRKLHIGIDAETGQILASELTTSDPAYVLQIRKHWRIVVPIRGKLTPKRCTAEFPSRASAEAWLCSDDGKRTVDEYHGRLVLIPP
jgi:hypothetical protein